MNRVRAQGWAFWIGIVLALLLMLMPLPAMIQPLKPYWPALVLTYWSLEATDRVGVGLAFCVGLAADLLNGALLGDQALRLAVLVFIVLRFRSRLRFFPMWQQALAVWLLLLNNHVLQALIRAFAGDSPMPALSWLAPAVGAAIWPFVFLLLDDVNTRLRGKGAKPA
ncbi:MAG: Rod shape-determining protein MreD [Rhodanobacteraceae bacterium]|jgi:rod shape-determining protein MreD|nr:MAG: Rod shape-determining protein MreD [Rhodanobacteraceae bacterium]